MNLNLLALYQQHRHSLIFTDLTHAFFPGQPHWPGHPDEKRRVLSELAPWVVHQYTLVGQWGTHIDAPLHAVPGGVALDGIPASEALLPLVVLDVHEHAQHQPDYRASLENIHQWESCHGRIPPGAFVALRTDWSRRWPHEAAMRNADASGISHFPGWSLDALEFLFEKRGAVAIGHETTDTDGGEATSRGDYTGEHYVLGRGHWQVELMTNLSQVPPAGALLIAAWPKPRGGSGFPARVIALHTAGGTP